VSTDKKRQLANLLAHLWCRKRCQDAEALDQLARMVHGADWWAPYFGPELEPAVRRFLYGAPTAHPAASQTAEDSPSA